MASRTGPAALALLRSGSPAGPRSGEHGGVWVQSKVKGKINEKKYRFGCCASPAATVTDLRATHLLGPVAGVRHNIPNTKANKEHQGGRQEEGGEVQTDVVRVVTKSLRRSNSLLPA